MKKQKIETLTKEVKKQLQTYEKDGLVTKYLELGVELKKIIMVFHGWELVQMEKKMIREIK